ncbi:MAG TPA: tRNA lysidine(34) synthetase TilS [Ruminococcus sp.]|nr:tRNA lysidine(34) synthetase TilS [Ruminococcus sp.]
MNPNKALSDFLTEHGIHHVLVTCALSGGADSVCLLYCLNAVAEKFHLQVSAVHVQHHLRGEESQRDELFCRQLCEKWNIPLQVVPVDVRGLAEKKKISVETSARECRYSVFSACECDYVATAHTASDNLETVLFRVARGTALQGLCGIPAIREKFIRPFLNVSRIEIESFLQEKKIAFVNDSTNFSDDYSRNFIRHQIIPAVKKLNPSCEQNCFRMTETISQDADFLELSAQNAYAECFHPESRSLKFLQNYHPAIRRRLIAHFLKENHFSPSLAQITAVEKLLHEGGKIDLDRSGVMVCYGRNTLWLESQRNDCPSKTLELGENTIFQGVFLHAEVIDKTNSEKFATVHKKFTDSVLDYDIIKGYAELHARKAGLSFLPAGKKHHVFIKKWLNSSVAPELRRTIHFLSDESGLLWVEGLGVAERAKITDSTNHMLFLYLSRN